MKKVNYPVFRLSKSVRKSMILTLFVFITPVIAFGLSSGTKKQKNICDEVEIESILELEESLNDSGADFLPYQIASGKELALVFSIQGLTNYKLLSRTSRNSVPFLSIKRFLSYHNLRLMSPETEA